MVGSSFLPDPPFGGDSGVSLISGKRWAIKGGLMENYPSTPVFSHMLVSLSFIFSFFSAITFFFFFILTAIFLSIIFFFLSNRSLLVNFYKLYFLSSLFFFFQSNERIFYFSIPLTKHT